MICKYLNKIKNKERNLIEKFNKIKYIFNTID